MASFTHGFLGQTSFAGCVHGAFLEERLSTRCCASNWKLPANRREMDMLYNQPYQTMQPHSSLERFKEPDYLQFALKQYMWQEPKLDAQAPMAPGNNLGTNLCSLDY